MTQVALGIAGNRDPQPFVTENIHYDCRNGSAGFTDNLCAIAAILTDLENRVGNAMRARGKIEIEEFFRFSFRRVVPGVALHRLPAGERSSVAGVLQLGARHVGHADVEPAAHHDGHRYKSSREDRQGVAAAVPCEGRKKSVLVAHDQPTTPEYGRGLRQKT